MSVSISQASEPRSIGSRFRELWRGFWGWRLLALLTVLGLAAASIGAWQTGWSDALWLEVAKGGVQVVAVGVLGGALALAWREVTARRERQSQRNDKIMTEFVSMVALYNQVKGVRRTLRSLGLDLNTRRDPEMRQVTKETASLTDEQARGFHTQMLILSGLQLEFESKVKQFGESDLLGIHTPNVVDQLGLIENHLNRVLTLWEEDGWTIREGTPLAQVSDGLIDLFRIRGHFGNGVSNPMKEIRKVINQEFFGEATKETQAALKQVELKDRKLTDRSDARGEKNVEP